MSFEVSDFIRESNLIDPQPSFDETHIIPGSKPGEPLYDNHLRAYELALEKIAAPLTASDVLDIHRELTRGIDFFEYIGMSGRWRKVNVHIRGTNITFAPSYLVHWLMNDVWAPFYTECVKESEGADDETKERLAYEVHDMFECIHPFIDGNGRTGRVLLNATRVKMGLKPIVILYKERQEYYSKINAFRASKYDTIVSKYNTHKEAST